MRLKYPTQPEAGTVIGLHIRHSRFVSVVGADFDEQNGHVELRYSLAEETMPRDASDPTPRSMAEIHFVTKRVTAYGMARVQGHNGFKPSPRPRPPVPSQLYSHLAEELRNEESKCAQWRQSQHEKRHPRKYAKQLEFLRRTHDLKWEPDPIEGFGTGEPLGILP